MAKAIQELPSFNAVAPGQVATVRIPETAAYSAIFVEIQHGGSPALMTKADMKTHIESIKLKIAPKNGGSQTVWDITGEEYLELMDFYEVPSETGILVLNFNRPWLYDVPGIPDGKAEDRFALGTADLGNVTLELKLSASVVSPLLTAYAEIFAEGNFPLGQFVKLDATRGYNIGAAGTKEIPDLPVVGPGVGLVGVHFKSSLITDLEMVVNGSIYRKVTPALSKTAQNLRAFRSGGRTWQTGYTHVDIAGSRYTDIVETTGWRDFRFKLDFSGSATFDVITETVIGRP